MAFQSRAKRQEPWVQRLSWCWAAASTINVLLSSSNARWKQLSKEKEKHFALTGDAEGEEEAGEVCCLVPLILLSVEASQRGSATAPEKGVEEKAVFSSCPSSKVKPIFSLCYCARAASTENTECLTLITGLDTSLTATEMDTLNFAPSLRREWWSSETRTGLQSRGLDHVFLCFAPGIYLFRVILYSTRGAVFSLRNMGHLGSKYHFSTLLEGRALLLFTLS